jgi:N utilization substance protein A
MLSLEQVIDQVVREKGIDRKVFVEALEEAIHRAAQKVFGEERELEAHYNPDVGQVELFIYMVVRETVENDQKELNIDVARKVDPEVLEGDELGFQIFYREEDKERAQAEDEKFGDILGIRAARATFGRIAAQKARNVVMQRVREAERSMIYNEFKDKAGELVTGQVRRFERGNVIVDLGRTEAILPRSEHVYRESYRAGDRILAYVKKVERETKGRQIVLSRKDPGMVLKLFEMEVPEIYEGIVRIMSIAREPGERTKIAVASTAQDVDPIGACVGMRGSRVQAVVQELRGEKIDIVPFHEDVAKFVYHAIAPAEVARVLVDEDNKVVEVVVPNDQLSLAIGRRGQNVRLASQLVGWTIDVHSEAEVDKMMDELMHHLVEGIGMVPEVVQALMQLGYHSVEHIATATAEELAQVPDLEGQDAMKMVELARTIMDQKSAGTYVSPFDTSSQDDANQEVDEESKEDEGNDLSYLGPLADLGPIPNAKPDDVVSAEESPAPHADEV